MEIKLRQREKIKAEALKPGDTFKLIDEPRVLLVVDLSQHDMFKPGADGKGPTLREDVVYYSELSTGVVGTVSKNVEVYRIQMKAEEVL